MLVSEPPALLAAPRLHLAVATLPALVQLSSLCQGVRPCPGCTQGRSTIRPPQRAGSARLRWPLPRVHSDAAASGGAHSGQNTPAGRTVLPRRMNSPAASTRPACLALIGETGSGRRRPQLHGVIAAQSRPVSLGLAGVHSDACATAIAHPGRHRSSTVTDTPNDLATANKFASGIDPACLP